MEIERNIRQMDGAVPGVEGEQISESIHIVSVGGGVQSSTMCLKAACGEITPMPIAGIFADTQAESQSTYHWLDWLEKQLPFPIYRVTKGSLEKEALTMRITKDGRKSSRSDIPFFTLSSDNQIGKIVNRSCTRDFKLKPIHKLAHKLGHIKRGQKTVGVIQWVGISLDEVYRMKESRDPWYQIRWPLIEQRVSRQDCLRWMEQHGYPKPPRSACVFCPYHSDTEWRRLKTDEPEEFAKAVKFERDIQRVKHSTENFASTPFLHRTCVPLDKIDFSTDEERGQLTMFNEECEGLCGV